MDDKLFVEYCRSLRSPDVWSSSFQLKLDIPLCRGAGGQKTVSVLNPLCAREYPAVPVPADGLMNKNTICCHLSLLLSPPAGNVWSKQ